MVSLFIISIVTQYGLAQELPSLEEFKENTTCSEQKTIDATFSVSEYFIQTYENPRYDFSFSYPSDWQLTERFCTTEIDAQIPLADDVITVPVSQSNDNVGLFSTPNSKEQGMFDIVVTTNPQEPLSEYVKYLEIYQGVSNVQPITFNGYPAYQMDFILGENKLNQIIFDVNSDRFNLSYLASPDGSTMMVEQILNSFKISPQ